jgi:protein O-mannosyl-transferase
MKVFLEFIGMRPIILLSVVLIAITCAVYWQVGDHGFLNLDDNDYVTENPHVATGLTGSNLRWAVTSVAAANWHPLTWVSHMVDAQLYGREPRGHHLTSVALHAASALLLFLLLVRATGFLWRSLFVAALFALHPLHVESVAWVAERKDVLSALFWYLTLLFYLEYATRRKTWLYLSALLCFVLGLMSKPMLVTLPIVMLLLDFWPLGRYRLGEGGTGQGQLTGTARTLVTEKLPFFACSLLSGLITVYAQHTGGATKSLSAIPFPHRLENALVAYAGYLGKTLWPHDLAVYYPIPDSFALWQVAGSLVLLLVISFAVLRAAGRLPYLLVGWFWFLITLLPVIGLLQVGEQAMADRYSYLPAVGLFIMAAWGIPDAIRGWPNREALLSLAGALVLGASAALTWQQLGYWQDNISLYRHTLSVTSGNYLMHNNLGLALAEKGELDAAIAQYQETLRIVPTDLNALNNLGLALASKGNLGAAIQQYQEALRIKPDDAKSHNNLGLALAGTGALDDAIRQYQEVLRTHPDDQKVHLNLGAALAGKGDLPAALVQFREAVRIRPDDMKAHNNLGVALAGTGDLDNAILEYREALRIHPDYSEAHNNLGVALAGKGEAAAAILQYREALRTSPGNAMAQKNLAEALAKGAPSGAGR